MTDGTIGWRKACLKREMRRLCHYTGELDI